MWGASPIAHHRSAPLPSPSPSRDFAGERLGAVAVVLSVNLVASLVVLALQSGALLSRVLFHPTAGDRLHLLAYSLCVFGALALAGLLVAGVASLVVPRRWLIAAVAVVSGALLMGLYLDGKLYLFLGLHLYDRAVIESLQQSDLAGTLHASRGELGFGAALAIGLGACEILLARAADRRFSALGVQRQRRALTFLLAGTLALVALSGAFSRHLLRSSEDTTSALVPILPLHRLLFDRAPRPRLVAHATAPLDYPKRPGAPVLRRLPDVLFIAEESLRSDAVSPEKTPNFSRFASQRECVRTGHHHSGSNVTQLGIFSLLYGLDTYYYDPFYAGTVPSYPLGVLRSNGYLVEGGCSAKINSWGEMRLMTDQLAPYYEPDGADPAERDAQLETWAEKQLRTRDPNRPLFLFLFFDATHFNYYYPPEFERAKPTVPIDANFVMKSVDDPALRQGLRNRYENSVLYMDSVFGRLMDAFGERWREGELIVILTGDHGEEFWDEGLWGHPGRFLKSRTQVPLLFCAPGLDAPTVAISSHVDVMPTLLDALDPTVPIDPASYSTGVSLRRSERSDRTLLISEQGLTSWSDRLQLVTRDHKFALRQGNADAAGRHPYTLLFARGPDDEIVEDTPALRQELDARLPAFDASFGSFFRR